MAARSYNFKFIPANFRQKNLLFQLQAHEHAVHVAGQRGNGLQLAIAREAAQRLHVTEQLGGIHQNEQVIARELCMAHHLAHMAAILQHHVGAVQRIGAFQRLARYGLGKLPCLSKVICTEPSLTPYFSSFSFRFFSMVEEATLPPSLLSTLSLSNTTAGWV